MTDIFDKSYQRHWLQRVGPKCRLGETLSTPAPRHSATSSPAALCLLTVSAQQLTAHACTRFDTSPGTEMPAPGHIPQRLNASGQGPLTKQNGPVFFFTSRCRSRTSQFLVQWPPLAKEITILSLCKKLQNFKTLFCN